MAKYLVDYYETYSKSYEIEADSKEEAEEKIRYDIQEGKLDPPENCSDSWCETEELKNEKDVRFTPFSRNELDLMYASCMAYGNKLFEIAREIPNESQIMELLTDRAKESWNMAEKITNYLDN